MEAQTSENVVSQAVVSQALFRDSSIVNAVTSLLRLHNGTKEKADCKPTPMLTLANMVGKEDSLCAHVVLGSASGKAFLQDGFSELQGMEKFSSFEQVHALATANLVASTQRDIEQQLAQQADSFDLPQTPAARKERRKRPAKDREEGEEGQKISTKALKSKVTPEPDPKCVVKSPESDPSPTETASEFVSVVKKDVERPPPQPLTCSFEGCNRKFAWFNHLKYHEMTHTNNRKHKCPVEGCGKSFFTNQRLNVHSLTHTGERPFCCDYPDCGKSFTTAGNLKNHQRIHTGEQPFACEHPGCERRFTERSSLRKHSRTHTGEKPFSCDQCSKTFTQLGTLRKHNLTHQIQEELSRSRGDDLLHQHCRQAHTEDVSDKGSRLRPVKKGSGGSSRHVLVLQNPYPGLPAPESMLFSPGLSEHIVTPGLSEHIVTVSNQQLGKGVSQNLFTTPGVDRVLADKTDELIVMSGADKTDELIVMSGADLCEGGDSPRDLVYTTDILEAVGSPHTSYFTAQVGYTGDVPPQMFHEEEVGETAQVGYRQGVSPQTFNEETVTARSDEFSQPVHLGVPEYEDAGKGLTSTDAGCFHLPVSDFIGAEEIAVATSYSLSATPSLFCRSEDEDGMSCHFSQTLEVIDEDMTEDSGHDKHSSLLLSLGEANVSEGLGTLKAGSFSMGANQDKGV